MRALFFRLLAGGVAAASSGVAAETVLRSGPSTVSLIELYTSEGCSSCPPAEKWLGALREEAGLWTRFVPVAFHVNYWDHLGWRDALASKAFTEREYAYANAWRSGSVYTPCFVRDGAEWRPRNASPEPAMKSDPGVLTLAWDAERNLARIEFAPADGVMKTDKPAVTVALLGSEIVSDVKRGENAGRALRHDFVALRLAAIPLIRGADGTWTTRVKLEARGDIAAPKHALAAWITQPGKLEPEQVVGGWVP
jgi:hypothetical protein